MGVELLLQEFLEPVRELRETLGCLLVQLPPSLAFDEAVALAFFSLLRLQHEGPVACEPRHASWFTPEVDAFLAGLRVSRVAADPDKPVGAAAPGGYAGLRYYRLHGSPRTYYSSYEESYLRDLAQRIRTEPIGTAVWCIFDNTTLGAAMPNALELERLLGR